MFVGLGRSKAKHVPPPTVIPMVYIVSSALNSLPSPGNRVGPGDASNMPTIQAATGNNAIKTASGAHHYRLIGLNVKAPTTLLQGAAIAIGGGETLLSQFPTDIVVDRCLIQGDATAGLRRGVQLDGIRCAVVDSYIKDCKEGGSDTQAVWAYNTPGPLKIVNNYLEAAGENLMTGGADPLYANSVPSDIEIRRNYFKKQSAASWKASWSVKNLLEFKNAQRVLVEGNVLDTNYGDSQNGFALLITPRNQDGTASWCTTRDITYRYNKITNVEGGWNISGTDGANPSQRTYRITIQDNLLTMANLGQGGVLRCHGIIDGPVDVQIINNTFVHSGSADDSSCGFHENPSPKADGTIWRSNVFDACQYGILGTATGEGTSTFNAYFSNYTYSYNVMYRSPNGSGNYPAANNQFATAATDVFTDYSGGDYTVKAAYQNDGSDGTDPGCDISAVNSYTQYAETGLWGSEPATYSDRTYTNAELPREYVNTTYQAQSGNTWTATNTSSSSVAGTGTGNRTDCSLTYALANCAVGDTIVLTAGATYTPATYLTLRNI